MNAAVVFPGQGSQFVGMADAWIAHDASRSVLDVASASMGRDLVAGCRDEVASHRRRRGVEHGSGRVVCGPRVGHADEL